jgi:hypothetical protein
MHLSTKFKTGIISLRAYASVVSASVRFFARNLFAAGKESAKVMRDFGKRYFKAYLISTLAIMAICLITQIPVIFAARLHPLIMLVHLANYDIANYVTGVLEAYYPLRAITIYAMRAAAIRLGLLFEDNEHSLNPNPLTQTSEYLEQLAQSINISKSRHDEQCDIAYTQGAQQMEQNLNYVSNRFSEARSKASSMVQQFKARIANHVSYYYKSNATPIMRATPPHIFAASTSSSGRRDSGFGSRRNSDLSEMILFDNLARSAESAERDAARVVSPPMTASPGTQPGTPAASGTGLTDSPRLRSRIPNLARPGPMS